MTVSVPSICSPIQLRTTLHLIKAGGNVSSLIQNVSLSDFFARVHWLSPTPTLLPQLPHFLHDQKYLLPPLAHDLPKSYLPNLRRLTGRCTWRCRSYLIKESSQSSRDKAVVRRQSFHSTIKAIESVVREGLLFLEVCECRCIDLWYCRNVPLFEMWTVLFVF